MLENTVGRVLVLRDKPASLTESGQIVMRLARQIGVLEKDMLTSLAINEPELSSIPIVVSADSLATWILPALATLDGIAFDIVREDQAHSKNLLKEGSVMAAVTSDPNPLQGCHATSLGTMTYRPMAGNRWIEKWMPNGFDREVLRSAPVVVFDRKDDLQDTYLRGIGIDPAVPPRHYVPGSGEFVEAVALGFGWGMVPTMQAHARTTGPALVALDSDASIDVPLYWHQWSLDSRALAIVSSALTSAAQAALF
jgi:LysR family transcriptional regulator (chromosome initiation inhibitor)